MMSVGSKKVNDVQQPKSFSRIFSSARMIIYVSIPSAVFRPLITDISSCCG